MTKHNIRKILAMITSVVIGIVVSIGALFYQGITDADNSTMLIIPPDRVYSNEINYLDNIRIGDKVPNVEPLTDEEKSRALDIIKQNESLKPILETNEWYLHSIMGRYKENGTKIGADVHIIFKKSVWFDGSYIDAFTLKERHASMWVSSLTIAVDLNKNKIVGMEPGMARLPGDTPSSIIPKEAENTAREYAINKLGENIEIRLHAIMRTPELSGDIAMFMIMKDNQPKMFVAVELKDMSIDEKHTGEIGGV